MILADVLLESRHDIGKVTGTMRIGDLPDDMQQLVQDWSHSDVDWDAEITVYDTPVAMFPHVEGDTAERGDSYIASFDLDSAPPVMVSGRYWADGWHRVEQARRTGRKTIKTIDLAEIGQRHTDVIGELNL